jgi:hypothetical protein
MLAMRKLLRMKATMTQTWRLRRLTRLQLGTKAMSMAIPMHYLTLLWWANISLHPQIHRPRSLGYRRLKRPRIRIILALLSLGRHHRLSPPRESRIPSLTTTMIRIGMKLLQRIVLDKTWLYPRVEAFLRPFRYARVMPLILPLGSQEDGRMHHHASQPTYRLMLSLLRFNASIVASCSRRLTHPVQVRVTRWTEPGILLPHEDLPNKAGRLRI